MIRRALTEVLFNNEATRTVDVVRSSYLLNETQEEIAAKYKVAHTTVGRWLADFRVRAAERVSAHNLAV